MSDPVSVEESSRESERLHEIVARALDEARAAGATSAEASASTSTGLAVNVRLGEVETIEHTRDHGLGITVYIGNRKGSASTTDFSEGALRETSAAACSIARHTAEDECAGLADAALMATDLPDLDLEHPWSIDAEQAIEIAVRAEDTARAVDPRITNSEGAGVNVGAGEQVYGNSHGFIGATRATRHSLSCVVIAEDDAGMQRDYWYTVSRRPQDLETPEAVGRKAGERTVRRLGASQLDTRTVPVLFAAEIAGGLIGHFVGAVRGSSLYRGASFLVDSLGEQVFADHVRIHEQPHLPRALGSACFDNEGVQTRDRDIVAAGVLQGYVLGSYAARKLGMQTTANAGGVHNLTVDPSPGEATLEDLLAGMDEGLLVTELMGMGVNTTTGDYSRGAAGYWVSGGRISHPVEEITIAGNLREMFRNVRAVGADVDLRGNVRTGSILVDEMTIAGQ